MAMHTTLIVFIFFILLIYWFWVYDYSNHDFGIYALNILASILKFLDVKEAGKLVFFTKGMFGYEKWGNGFGSKEIHI